MDSAVYAHPESICLTKRVGHVLRIEMVKPYLVSAVHDAWTATSEDAFDERESGHAKKGVGRRRKTRTGVTIPETIAKSVAPISPLLINGKILDVFVPNLHVRDVLWLLGDHLLRWVGWKLC